MFDVGNINSWIHSENFYNEWMILGNDGEPKLKNKINTWKVDLKSHTSLNYKKL